MLPHKRRLLIVAALGLSLLCGWAWMCWTEPGSEELLNQARDAFARQDYERAERAAVLVLERTRAPFDETQKGTALLIAGDSAARLKQFRRAIDYYEQLPDDGSGEALSAQLSLGLVYRELGYVSRAERCFRKVLRQNPQHIAANNAMAHLLGFEGRSWEAVPFLLEPVRQGRFNLNHLLLLGSTAPIVQDPTLSARWRSAEPEYPVPLIATARHALFAGDAPSAESMLRRIVRAAPEQIEAQARLGWLLLESADPDSYRKWHSHLPPRADDHPEIWTVRGTWAQRQRHPEAAARCFWEAVRRDPDHQTANYQLQHVLTELGKQQEAQPFLLRAGRLSELSDVTNVLRTDRRNMQRMRQAAELCESLGRLWEAWGWCRVAREIDPQADWPERGISRLAEQLRPELPRTLPAFAIDLSSYPMPDRDERASEPDSVSPGPLTQPSPPGRGQGEGAQSASIRFHDVAREAGIDFRHFNGAEGDSQTNRMFEQNGPGVAVLDYDLDGHSDLYFTQGCRWPPGEHQEHRDQFYRNLAGGGFQEVAAEARLGDRGFGQGVTAGDYNNDGFPDLYVANIGANRLYVNNGDGTFSDVTAEAGTGGASWTTSCLIADLNGDSLPDIYAVNYLEGPDVFSRVCPRASGLTAGCGPEDFAAAQDRLYLNGGDGRFIDVTAACGIEVPDGKGLGILAADFSGNGLLDLYVANDTTANFYFVNRATKGGGPPSFSEEGRLSGLAFDWQGRPQAGMGIAADDTDNDGLLDLFVTNYYQEANAFYRQRSPELFRDDAQQAGLARPGYLMLGFGTQFLDADLDGWSDLVVANGHVHNLAAEGIRHRMRPQFFRNTGPLTQFSPPRRGQGEAGGGRYSELPAASLGEYFEREYLGRAVARLDWNRDGRVDIVITHLDAPAALLSNTSTATGRFLSISLRGVKSSRDAIGTTLWAQCGARRWMKQLTAGDGYQAANERRILFGLGASERVDELKVRWPSGLEQSFHDLAVDQEILLIEGNTATFVEQD